MPCSLSPFFLKFALLLLVLSSACQRSETKKPDSDFSVSTDLLFQAEPLKLFDSSLLRDGSSNVYSSQIIPLRRIPGTIIANVAFEKLFLNVKGQMDRDQVLVEIVMSTLENGLVVQTKEFIRAADFNQHMEFSVGSSAGKRVVHLQRSVSSATSQVSLAVYANLGQLGENQDLLAEVSSVQILQQTATYSVGTDSPSALKVLSFNIKAGRQEGSRDNLDKIAEFISSSRADVVMLQEVDKVTLRTGKVDQLEYLKQKTGLNGFYTKAIDLEGGEYGIALLSRYPFVAPASVSLDVTPLRDSWYEKRVLQLASIQVNDRTVGVGNTHLHIGEVYSNSQAEIVTRSLQNRFASDCFIMAGDFNSKPGTSVFQSMTKVALDSLSALVSLPPLDRIDYIFAKGLKPRFFQKTRVDFSDHDPITTSFDFESDSCH